MGLEKPNHAFHVRVKFIPKAPMKHFFLKGVCIAKTEKQACDQVLSTGK